MRPMSSSSWSMPSPASTAAITKSPICCGEPTSRRSWSPTKRTTRNRRETGLRVLRPRTRRADRRSPPITAPAPAICSTASSRSLPEAEEEDGDRRAAHRDRRPAECRQEPPAQRAARPGAGDRQRHAGHNAGQPRHADRLGRQAGHPDRHRRHPPPGSGRARGSSNSACSARCARSTAPMSCCWSSMRPRASPRRTCISPGTSRSRRRARRRRQQVGPDRERTPTRWTSIGSEARKELDFMPYAPLVFISAKFGQRVQQVLEMALDGRR